MSQALRNELVEDLRHVAGLKEKDVHALTDTEVEYYHWLYLEDSVYDLM